MSSSIDNADNKACVADKEGGDSTVHTAAKQIEDITIEKRQDVPIVVESTNNADNTDNIDRCAACGKEGEENNMNVCNKCKMAHYCNVSCKKKHKSKHKKKCDRRAAELRDEELFKKPPPREDCPICMLPLPIDAREYSFKSCCGKEICLGCICAMTMEEIRKGKKKEEVGMCAFCRSPHFSSKEEEVKRIKNLMESGNADAFLKFAAYYAQGVKGMPQDWAKANELLLKAGELGCAEAYSKLGNSYIYGRGGVEIDTKKAKYYLELAAMKGNVYARHNLGALEGKAGNHQRKYKHHVIAAKAGYRTSLDSVKQGFMAGLVTKYEYGTTLRAYQTRVDEMKSDMRANYIAFREWNGSR